MEFLLYFLPLFMLLYGITPRAYKNVTLFVGSLVFYAYGEPIYILFLLLSILVNYFVGLHIAERKKEKRSRHKRRKILLAAAIIGNIGVLMVFKAGLWNLGLPLGISFYTFQILSYLIDVYQGDIHYERSFLKFADYVAMFPKVVSGPLVRYGEIEGDLEVRRFTAKGVQDGIKYFIVGLAFKILLADRIGLLWHEVQVTGFESISLPLSWIAAIAYSFHIYFDFCGYSLMATGLGRMLGFELPENFRTPYMAKSVRDFYRRWHITLGRWFCRYVYIPLGGSRRGELRTAFNLLVIWLMTSLWHGGTLNYFLWGMLLCFLIVIERQLGKVPALKQLKILPHLYLWFVIPITWMCFAITDIYQLGVYLGRMFGVVGGIHVNGSDWRKALDNYGLLMALCAVCCTPVVKKVFDKVKDKLPGYVFLAVLFWVCVWRILLEGNNPFMYFRF